MPEPSKRTRLLVEESEFEELCGQIKQQRLVAFDSEFISEDSYRPEICLLQFATADRVVGVDPLRIGDLSSWWALMADPEVRVIVHGGQAEIRFCLEHHGKRPANLIDVQLAEGFRGPSYPMGYDSLERRVLGHSPGGKETRTDWRRRPLSEKQIAYALADVEHLAQIWQVQQDDLQQRGRLEWVATEVERMIDDLVAERQRPSWFRLGGLHRLRRNEFAAAIELADWREREARENNRVVRRVLRDDLIVELARRQPKTVAELSATRDMNRGGYRKNYDAMLACLERARKRPLESLPAPPSSDRSTDRQDEQVLGQLLGIALASRCAEEEIARTIVGTSADLRQLVRWHLYDEQQGEPPRLGSGWRAEFCGDLLADVMDGKIAMRVGDANSDHPLVFERSGGDGRVKSEE